MGKSFVIIFKQEVMFHCLTTLLSTASLSMRTYGSNMFIFGLIRFSVVIRFFMALWSNML